MFSEDTSHDIFVDVGTKGSVDLLSNPRAAETRVAPFHLDGSLNEFRGRPRGSRFAFAVGRIQQSILSLLEQAVESQQC